MSESQAWFFEAIAFATTVGAFCAIYFERRTSKQQSALSFDYNNTPYVNEVNREVFERFEELAKSIRTKHHFTLT